MTAGTAVSTDLTQCFPTLHFPFFLHFARQAARPLCARNRQRQVYVCELPDASTDRNLRAADAPACQINSRKLTRRCHQCELEKRWICSIPQRCYFHTHALHMLTRDQQADLQRGGEKKKKGRQKGVKKWRELRNFQHVCLLVHTVSVCSLSQLLWPLRRRVSHKCQAGR